MTFLHKFWEGWKKFGQMMGDFIGRLVLTILYFTVVLPFGLGARFGDPLNLRPKLKDGSYWLSRKTKDLTIDDARRQF